MSEAGRFDDGLVRVRALLRGQADAENLRLLRAILAGELDEPVCVLGGAFAPLPVFGDAEEKRRFMLRLRWLELMLRFLGRATLDYTASQADTMALSAAWTSHKRIEEIAEIVSEETIRYDERTLPVWFEVDGVPRRFYGLMPTTPLGAPDIRRMRPGDIVVEDNVLYRPKKPRMGYYTIKQGFLLELRPSPA